MITSSYMLWSVVLIAYASFLFNNETTFCISTVDEDVNTKINPRICIASLTSNDK